MTTRKTWAKLIALGVAEGSLPLGKWNLSGANLSGANLNNANFRSALLIGASLCKTLLIEAKLRKANLKGADLRGADLSKANLNNANLSGANLSVANLSGASLSRGNLSGTGLISTNLTGADLNGAVLSRADLSEVNFSEANLSGADLSGARLFAANLSGANLSKSNLSGADLGDANLSGAHLYAANFLDANLSGSKIVNSNIINVNFNNANLSGADITGAIFWGISTTGWKIDQIKAEYVYITRDITNKEKHKRIFKEGQFEALFKSLPTVDLIFEGGLSLSELWTLNAILEDIKKQNPELDLRLTSTSVNEFQTTISIRTAKDAFLDKTVSLITSKLEEAIKGIPIESLLPRFSRMLPEGINLSLTRATDNQARYIIMNNPNFTFSLIHGDGSIIQSSPNAKIENSNIINNYQNNKDEIERLVNQLKGTLCELGESDKKHMESMIDRLIAVLREGKEVTQAQQIWNEIKEGVKTGGSIGSIVSAAIALSKFFG